MEVNSPVDEAFPFFDYSKQTLYFSSKREGSVGGYDIFKSKLDTNRNKFSVPVILPFPVNTPLDDYLFILSNNESYLISNREVLLDKVSVYHISLDENSEVKVISAEKAPEAGILAINQRNIPEKQEDKEVITPDIENEKFENIQTNDIVIVAMALKAQSKADSVMLIIQKIKDGLVNTDDKSARNKLFSAIIKQERIVSKFQKDADEYYQKLIIADSLQNIDTGVVNYPKKVYADFQYIGSSPYYELTPFINEIKLPEGIAYRIQLGIFSKPVAYDYFGGLQPISAELLQDGKLIKYCVGVFNRFSEADNSLIKVKAMGFKEAFITGYLNNRKIPVERAKDLETTQ
jgi:hypothetical protein